MATVSKPKPKTELTSGADILVESLVNHGVDTIFAYPGMGYLLYQAIVTNDYSLIQGIVFILIVATATAVLLIDLLYPFIDPRISYQQH